MDNRNTAIEDKSRILERAQSPAADVRVCEDVWSRTSYATTYSHLIPTCSALEGPSALASMLQSLALVGPWKTVAWGPP